ncbi:ASCH domain-containing protein [Lysinibacillus sp. KU-BSD001]|uniref:ASCH domain-containing protein n=1 Tax=Lysinibacillus sp. KU-BSD001 TaxID=3141328 RepID=UPI0036F065EC
MEYQFTSEEVQKAKSIIESQLDYKVADIQRAILKGYMYTARLIEHIKNMQEGVHMKAITIKQPWATLIALGEKKFETRSWQTKHRGSLAIHAGKSVDKEACDDIEIKLALAKHGITSYKQLPIGAVIATAEMVQCHGITKDWCEFGVAETDKGAKIEGDEYWFGYYEEGRYAWELANVKVLEEPVPAKGQLSLWEWANDDEKKEA